MIKNYIKSFWRNIRNNKAYSFLNVFGLSIGITCASLIFIWVNDEVHYDTVYPKRDRLYRVLENQTYEGKTRTFWATPIPFAPAIKAEVPGIAEVCRASFTNKLFSLDEKMIYEQGGFVDPSYFDLFSLEFVQGNAQTAFSQLHNVVITEKMAKQFFGDQQSIIGKQLTFDNQQAYTVAGVVKDLPTNSTLQFIDWLAPFAIYLQDRQVFWGNNSIATYVELEPHADLAAINKQLFDFIEKKQEGATARTFLFAAEDWHLRDQFEDGHQTGGRIEYVHLFSIIAWIILLIACINFMNLTTARSEKTAREVGVRKVLGAGRKSLIFKFMGEALGLSFLAVLLSIGLLHLVLPSFNLLVEKQLALILTDPFRILILLGIALLCGLIAGSYPAIYLSSFNPVSVFKGIRTKDGGPTTIRKTLVVLQFCVSIVLIISTILVFQQIQHVKNRDLGYEKQNLLSIQIHGDMAKKFPVLKQELLRGGMIQNAALNSFNTISIGNNASNFSWQGKDPNAAILISYRLISPEFINTAGIKLLDGRDFYPEVDANKNSIIISASLANLMGKENPIGKTIEFGDQSSTIIGVTKDFLYGDMYGNSDPLVFLCKPEQAEYLYIRIKADVPTHEALLSIEETMKKTFPEYPFDYQFVDEQFDQQFETESLVEKLSQLFAGLAILISCLGLFGLATYTAERRTKEMGVRKVLGATKKDIALALSRDFLKLVLIAAVFAFPIAWWLMNNWLTNYAYHITINPLVFIVSAALAVLIALITIGFQTLKTVRANPVKSLRSE